MPPIQTVNAGSIDIESGQRRASGGSEGSCCKAVAMSLAGAFFGGIGGALSGGVVKLGQLSLASFDHDVQNFNLADLALSGAVFAILSGGSYGFLRGLRGE